MVRFIWFLYLESKKILFFGLVVQERIGLFVGARPEQYVESVDINKS